MKIILGAFSNSYSELASEHSLVRFGGFYDPARKKVINNICDPIHNDLICGINEALSICDECYFDLTYVEFKLREISFDKITILELFLVVTTPEYLIKTKFFNDGGEIPVECVLEWFLHNPYWNQYL
jgi:hypothetical protein